MLCPSVKSTCTTFCDIALKRCLKQVGRSCVEMIEKNPKFLWGDAAQKEAL